MEINFIKQKDIDKTKWDRCVANAHNGLIYSYSFFLDIMSAGWDALVLNDYEVVMPLTKNKKFGIEYLYQPPFAQQLGLTGNYTFDENIIEQFLIKSSEHGALIDINLNYDNEYYNHANTKCNLILSLNCGFDEIEKGFRKDLKKNIAKAKRNLLKYEVSNDIDEAVWLNKSTYIKQFYRSDNEYNSFIQLAAHLKEHGNLLIRKVSTSEGSLLAIGVFMKDERRIYKTMTTTLPEGRKLEANHLLLYELIKEFSGQDIIVDFMGSSIPSIKSFCLKYGAIEQNYWNVQMNRLNFFQKSLKKAYDFYKKQRRKFN